jgi:hypothetical protein
MRLRRFWIGVGLGVTTIALLGSPVDSQQYPPSPNGTTTTTSSSPRTPTTTAGGGGVFPGPNGTTVTVGPGAPTVTLGISVRPTVVVAGQPVIINASGFAALSNVDLVLRSAPIDLGNVTADSGGRIAVAVIVPTGTPSGRHTISAVGVAPDGRPLVQSATLDVLPPGSKLPSGAASTGGLPRTGQMILRWALGALALLALGVVVVLADRRRRSRSA